MSRNRTGTTSQPVNMPTALERIGDFSQSADRHHRSVDRTSLPRQRDSGQPHQLRSGLAVELLPGPEPLLRGAELSDLLDRLQQLAQPQLPPVEHSHRNEGPAQLQPRLSGLRQQHAEPVPVRRHRLGPRAERRASAGRTPSPRASPTTCSSTSAGSGSSPRRSSPAAENVAAELGIAGTSQNPMNWGPPNLSFTNYAGLSDGNASLNRNQTGVARRLASRGFTACTTSPSAATTGGSSSTSSPTPTAAARSRSTAPPPATTWPTSCSACRPPAPSATAIPTSISAAPATTSTSTTTGASAQLQPHPRPALGLRHAGHRAVQPAGQPGCRPGLRRRHGWCRAIRCSTATRTTSRRGSASPGGRSNGHSLVVRGGYGLYYNTSVYNTIAANMAQQPPFAQSLNASTSAANVLTLQNGFLTATTSGLANTYAIDPNYRIGYAQTWNLTVQSDLPFGLFATAGYLGTKGTRLDQQFMPNSVAPGAAGIDLPAQLHLRDLERQLHLSRGAVPVEPPLPQRPDGERVVPVLEVDRQRRHRRPRTGRHAGRAELARPFRRARALQLRRAPQPDPAIQVQHRDGAQRRHAAQRLEGRAAARTGT